MEKSIAFKNLLEKIEKRTAKVCVMGMGYVGLPLAIEFCKAGYTVYGYDINEEKVGKLKRCESYVDDVKNEDLKSVVCGERLIPTTDISVIRDSDAVLIAVPTPLNKTKDPDISYIIDATEKIKKNIHPEIIIVLESTTYPGTTEELILPALESTGLKVGIDFFLAFSPERVDPGNKYYGIHN
ncbi:MAG: NAD(P)-binding domain-containing protein, partial [bacterium]